jgi:carbon-monoxide dehydrogenase large subunit
VGEAGTIGCTPAVVNAVCDALHPLGVRHIDMPLKPERVWRSVHESNIRPSDKEGRATAVLRVAAAAKGARRTTGRRA